jgi:hypothetical protein
MSGVSNDVNLPRAEVRERFYFAGFIYPPLSHSAASAARQEEATFVKILITRLEAARARAYFPACGVIKCGRRKISAPHQSDMRLPLVGAKEQPVAGADENLDRPYSRVFCTSKSAQGRDEKR